MGVDHVERIESMAEESRLRVRARRLLARLLLLLLAHRRQINEDAKVRRRQHRLVAQLRAGGVLGAFRSAVSDRELPHALAVVPLERGQPLRPQVLRLRVRVRRVEPHVRHCRDAREFDLDRLAEPVLDGSVLALHLAHVHAVRAGNAITPKVLARAVHLGEHALERLARHKGLRVLPLEPLPVLEPRLLVRLVEAQQPACTQQEDWRAAECCIVCEQRAKDCGLRVARGGGGELLAGEPLDHLGNVLRRGL